MWPWAKKLSWKKSAILLGGGAEAEGDVGGGDALGGGEDVGLDAPVVDGEPFAGAAPAAHDLVGDEEDVVLVAEGADFGEPLGGRDEDAVGSDDGLDDEGGDVVLVLDHVFEVVGAGDAAGGVGVLDGALVAVDFGGEDDAAILAGGLHGPAAGVSGGGDGGVGGAVVGAVAGDDLVLARIHAGDLEGGLVGVGSGGGEEELVEVGGEDFEEELREFGAGGGGVEGGGVGEGGGLVLDGLDDGGVVVAEVDAHELRGEVEEGAAVAVGEGAAVGGDEMGGVPVLLLAPGSVVEVAGEGDDFLGGECVGHGAPIGCGWREAAGVLVRQFMRKGGWRAGIASGSDLRGCMGKGSDEGLCLMP